MPDVSLNGIEFQIKGNSDKASNSIDSLIKNLNSLKSALAATNSAAKGTGTFKELAVSIKDFNDALKGGSERYKKFAQGLEDIAAASELLGEKTQHISDLATSMEKLSNSKISGAAFKNLADGMAAVGFATKFISKEALDNLERMATSLSKLAGVDLKGLGSAMNAVGRGKTLEPPSPVPSEIQDVINSGDQIDLLRLKLGELQTALQSAFEKGDLTGAIRIRQQIASVEAEIRKLEEAANEVVPTMGRFREALSSIGSFLGKYAGTAKKVFSSFGKVLAFPFSRAAKDIGGYAKSIWGVVGGFKRIVGYRLIRSIIREITQGFSEGIKNLYGWSKAMGGATISGKNFAQTMDGLATSSAYFKNSIGAAIAPLISALAPAIDFVIDKVVALINVINQLLALLGGATSWNKATRKAQEFEQAAGGAGGAAKEALRYLAPFDELNRLPGQNGSGGGGGGGADYDGMFEEQTEFLQGLKDFTDSIKAAVAAGDWEGLGTILGDKVNEVIDKIGWSGLGTKIGEKVNALFTTQYWTLKTINFQNIGASVAELLTGDNGIGGALREIDFTNIGGVIANKFTVLPEILVGAINQLDFSVVGQKFGETFRGFWDHISASIDGVDWNTTVKNLMGGLIDAIKGFDLTSALNSLGNVASSIADAVKDVDWSTVVHDTLTGIVDIIKNTDISGLVTGVLELLSSVAGAVAASIGTVVVDVAEAITNPDTWALVGAWLKDLPAKFKQAGITAVNSLVQPIVDGFNSFVDDHPNLASKLGLDHIEFELIPSLSEEELHKNYNAAKAKLEQESTKSPVGITASALVGAATVNLPSSQVNAAGHLLMAASANLTNVERNFSSGWADNNQTLRLPSVARMVGVNNEFPDGLVNEKKFLRFPSVARMVGMVNEFPTGLVNEKKYLRFPSIARMVGMNNEFPEGLTNEKKYLRFNSIARMIGMVKEFPSGLTNEKNYLRFNSIARMVNVDREFPSGWVNDKQFLRFPSIARLVNLSREFPSAWSNSSQSLVLPSVANLLSSIVNFSTTFESIASFASWINSLENTPSINASANITSCTDGMYARPVVNVQGRITSTISAVKSGGIFNGGTWSKIPQYAKGTARAHGSLFLAGEAGPEVVGHVGGRTEVLNRSQMAATMYAAVKSAMSSVNFNVYGGGVSAPMPSDSAESEEMLYRAFSRALADSDLGGDIELDGGVLYSKMVNRNRLNTRLTGVNAMA